MKLDEHVYLVPLAIQRGEQLSVFNPTLILDPAGGPTLVDTGLPGQADAIVRIRSGEIAATVLFSGKPVRLFSGVSIGDNLRLLTIPFTPTLENTYVPAALEADDYPNLIPKGQTVQTIGIDAVLITLNWPRASERYRRVAAFVEAFFSKFPELRKEPRHPKWQQVNLAAELPGWDRLPAAQEWLDRSKRQEPVQAQFLKTGQCGGDR